MKKRAEKNQSSQERRTDNSRSYEPKIEPLGFDPAMQQADLRDVQSVLRLQRMVGNRATVQALGRRNNNNKHSTFAHKAAVSSPTTVVQRDLPANVGMFSLELMLEAYVDVMKQFNDEVQPKATRVSELEEILNATPTLAKIDADMMREAAGKIRKVSNKPGEQPVEKATEEYLKAYETLDEAPTPDVEQHGLAEAVNGLDTALTEALLVEAEEESDKDAAALAAEKAKIAGIASNVGTGVETGLKIVKAAATGTGWADIGISVAKFTSTKIADWFLRNQDSFKQMEKKLSASKKRVGDLKDLKAAQNVEKASNALKKAAAALQRKLREIGNKLSELERAEKDLTIEMRALGLEDAAGAIEGRASVRQTSVDMLEALSAYEAAIQAVMPDAIKVYNSFDGLQSALTDPGPPLVTDPAVEMEIDSWCVRGKKLKTHLDSQLVIIAKSRAIVQSGHFEKLYTPVHKTLHGTQT